MERFILIYLLPVLSLISICLILLGSKAITLLHQAKKIDKGIRKVFDVFDHKSVFGKRITHFRDEKEILAKSALDKFEKYLLENSDSIYCLLIDSGTTMYPAFNEITKRVHNKGSLLNRNLGRLCVVTNNIPGMIINKQIYINRN